MTPKQQQFIDNYLITNNATEAAILSGYSVKTAASIGSENLDKPEIRKAIRLRQEKLSEKADIDADYILQKLNRNEQYAFNKGELVQSNRALELMAKIIGAFALTPENDGVLNVTVSHSRMAEKLAQQSHIN